MRPAFVLDIGSSKVSCMAAELVEGKLKLLGAAAVGTRGFARGSVTDLDELSKCLAVAFERLRQESKLELQPFFVSISGTSLHSETSRGVRPMYPSDKPVHQEDLLQVVNHSKQIKFEEGQALVQATPREYVLSNGEIVDDPMGKTTERLEVRTQIVTASEEHMNAIRSAIQTAGGEVEEFVPAPMASAMGVAGDSADPGCIVVDLGGGTTDVAVILRGACAFVGSIRVSSEHITNDVAALLKVSKEEADALKLTYGSTEPGGVDEADVLKIKQKGADESRPFPRKVLCEIIESRSKEIAEMCKAMVEASDVNEELPSQIILTGGGSQLPGFAGLFGAVFGNKPCKVVSPKIGGTNSSKVSVPEMATLIGLAEFALEEEDDQLVPASGANSWKDKIRTFKQRLGGG